jgi:hypothetical protein
VGALLRDTFVLLTRNLSGFALLLGISLAGRILLEQVTGPGRGPWPFRLAESCVSAFGTAAFISWTTGGLLQKRERSMLSALGVAVSRLPALFFMNLLFGLVVGVGAFFLLLPGIYLALRLSLASCVLVVEGDGPVQALNTSYRLTRRHWIPLLGTLAIILPLYVLAWVAGSIGFSALGTLSSPLWKDVGTLVQEGLKSLAVALLQGTLVLAWFRITQQDSGRLESFGAHLPPG